MSQRYTDVNSPCTLVELPLMVAARGYNPRKCLELLIESGANVNKVFDTGYESFYTPLTAVCQSASPRCVSMLLKEGADVNFSRGKFLSLHEAVSYGHFESAKLLLEAGADVNRRDSFGQTPLHEAIRKIKQKCSNLLIKSGTDVNIADNRGITPLMENVTRYCGDLRLWHRDGKFRPELRDQLDTRLKFICQFLTKGVEINRLDFMGRNSLHICIAESVNFSVARPQVNNLELWLYAAGETLHCSTVPKRYVETDVVEDVEIPEYFQELKERLDLKHLCREAIRKHLIDLDPHEHLFGRIPQLGLPSIVMEYLMYDCSLDPETAFEEEEEDDDD